MHKFSIGETVYIKSTQDTGLVVAEMISTMGLRTYKLETNGAYDPDYLFYESEIESVDKQLMENGYSDYLDAEPELYLSLEERAQAAMQKYKFDKGKSRHSLIEPEFMEELLAVLEFGASKYSEGSWKNVSEKRYADALYRHFLMYQKGHEVDVESGCSHMAHIAANAMFILHFINKGKTND